MKVAVLRAWGAGWVRTAVWEADPSHSPWEVARHCLWQVGTEVQNRQWPVPSLGR